MSDDLIDKHDASEYVKYLSKNLGGSGGGGRKDFLPKLVAKMQIKLTRS